MVNDRRRKDKPTMRRVALGLLALLLPFVVSTPPASAWVPHNENAGWVNYYAGGPPPGPSLSLMQVSTKIDDNGASPEWVDIVGHYVPGSSATVAVCAQAVYTWGSGAINGDYRCEEMLDGDGLNLATSAINGNPNILGARFQAYNAFGLLCEWDVNLTSQPANCHTY